MRIEKLSEEIKRKLPVGTRIVFNTDIAEPTQDETRAQVVARKGDGGRIVGTERPRNNERYWAMCASRPAFLVNIKDFDVEGQVLRGATLRARAGL